jgi:hypothetical protein
MFNIAHSGTLFLTIFPGISGFYWVTTETGWTGGASFHHSKSQNEAYFSAAEEAAFASGDGVCRAPAPDRAELH